jgi:uncharacterized membrane protein YkoI
VRKLLFTIIMISILAISVTGCTETEDASPIPADEAEPSEEVSSADSAISPENETAASEDVITLDRAKEIALAHAGLEETDVTFVKSWLETDDGRQEYEIEFYRGNTEYDYDIDALTGDIVSYDSDAKNYSRSGSTQSAGNNTYIGEEKAKSIALAKVSGATESDIRLYLDSEDGKPVYEGSILFNNTEYEFEIDAVTGTVLQWNYEPADDDDR